MSTATAAPRNGAAEHAPGLDDALLAFQSEAVKLIKDAEATIPSTKGAGYKYKYVTLKAILAIVLPRLTEHELVWTARPTILDGQPALAYRLLHVPSGDAIEDVMPLFLTQQSPQGYGAAVSYARRYAMLTVLGLVGEDDTDGRTPGTRAPRAEAPMSADRPKSWRHAKGTVDTLKAAAAGLSGSALRQIMTTEGHAWGPTAETYWTHVPPDAVAALVKRLGGAGRP